MKNEKTVSAVDNNPVNLQSAAIALVVSVCMSLGFMVMLATAFRIEHKLGNVFIYSLIVSAVFCFCYHFKNKWLSMTCLILPPVVLGLLILTDIWGVGTGLLQFIENFEIYATFWFLENNTVVAEKSTSVMAFFYAYNLISISVTTYALMRRKFILPSLISYLPFFICSVINTAKMPDQLPVVIASAGFIGALAMHFTRKKKREIAEKMMNNVKLCTLAVSLGDCETLIEHPGSMTHSTYTEEEMKDAGFTKKLVRLSVGLECADDIIADLDQALKAAKK